MWEATMNHLFFCQSHTCMQVSAPGVCSGQKVQSLLIPIAATLSINFSSHHIKVPNSCPGRSRWLDPSHKNLQRRRFGNRSGVQQFSPDPFWTNWSPSPGCKLKQNILGNWIQSSKTLVWCQSTNYVLILTDQVTQTCRPSLLQYVGPAPNTGPLHARTPPWGKWNSSKTWLKDSYQASSHIMDRVEPLPAVVVSIKTQLATEHWRGRFQCQLVIW